MARDPSDGSENALCARGAARARRHDVALCSLRGEPEDGLQVVGALRSWGLAALEERSRRPHHSPQATEAAVLAAILEIRRHHPTWGGKKLAATLARLSPLSVWWLRLGIRPERIQPGHPEQNGRHERMHRTLKAETQRPPAGSRGAQQRAFDCFRHTFNEERPHEALGQRPPAALHRPCTREYPETLPPLQYPAHWEVRRVSHNGGIRWHNRWVNVSHVLAEEYIGFEETGDDLWDVHFGPVVIGHFHEPLLRIEDANGKLVRNPNKPAHPAPVLPMSLD